jgi:hypothetical protein
MFDEQYFDLLCFDEVEEIASVLQGEITVEITGGDPDPCWTIVNAEKLFKVVVTGGDPDPEQTTILT